MEGTFVVWFLLQVIFGNGCNLRQQKYVQVEDLHKLSSVWFLLLVSILNVRAIVAIFCDFWLRLPSKMAKNMFNIKNLTKTW